jgi:hypothetical protein
MTHRPIPVPDEFSAPFFDGARAGKLMLQRCLHCIAAGLGSDGVEGPTA